MLRDEDLKCFLPHGDWGEERRHTEGLSLIWNLAPNTAEKASIRNSLKKNLSFLPHPRKKENQEISLKKKKKSGNTQETSKSFEYLTYSTAFGGQELQDPKAQGGT